MSMMNLSDFVPFELVVVVVSDAALCEKFTENSLHEQLSI